MFDTLSLLSASVRGIPAHISSQYSRCAVTCMPDPTHDELQMYTQLSLYTRQPHTADALTTIGRCLQSYTANPTRRRWRWLQGKEKKWWANNPLLCNNVWLLWWTSPLPFSFPLIIHTVTVCLDYIIPLFIHLHRLFAAADIVITSQCKKMFLQLCRICKETMVL